ncbi:peptidylprolyl isomerase [candidate division KSB1 bacterium]
MKNLTLISIFVILLTILGCGPNNPVVIIQTEMGDIEVELYPIQAPVTVANFLAYVDSSMYENGRFHRTVTMDNQQNDDVKIEVIQGSRTQRGGRGFPSIVLERTSVTGILHKDGTISMARSGPDTASSSFFICINDQPSLDFGGARNADGQGFAAFGQVIKGMDVVRKIHVQPVGEGRNGQTLDPEISITNIIRKVDN